MNNRLIAVLLGAAALAVPAAAAAEPGPDKGHMKPKAEKVGKGKKGKTRMYVFKGTFAAPETVHVSAGNAHVRKGGFVGQAVSFDFAAAKIVAGDSNSDGKVDLTDVHDGDLVLVQARMPKGSEYAAAGEGESTEPLAARKLIDKANPPLADDVPVETAAPVG
jgi:hypothetical protein